MWLIFRTNHDLPTQYLYAYIGKAIQYIGDRIELNGKDANRENFENTIKNYPINVFIGGGHGDYDRFAGWENQIVLRACDNDNLLSDKIVYLISCRCARELGGSSVKKNAKVFIGYLEDFVFAIDDRYIDMPLNDPVAKSFFDPAIEVINTIARGESVDMAYYNSQQKFNEQIKYWYSKNVPEAPYIISLLMHDRDYQTIIGETSVAVPAAAIRVTAFPIFILPIFLIATMLLFYRK